MSILDLLFHRGNDLTTQFLPDALFFKESILNGRFPVWNPWIFAGMPYLLDPQNFLWYPPNYVLLFLPLEIGFFLLLVGHLVFAGVFMAKILGKLPQWAQILGVFLFTLSPKLMAFLEEGNWTLLVTATWLPFLYWSLLNNRKRWTGVTLATLLINNINIAYYATIFFVLWFLFKRKPLRELLFIVSFAMALSAPRWIPLALYGTLTVRSEQTEAPLPFWSWTKLVKSLTTPILIDHPELQNEEILFVGITPLIIAIVALTRILKNWRKNIFGRWSKEEKFWFVWIILVVLITVNVKTPLFTLIKFLPGFTLLRITTRIWVFVPLGLSLFLPWWLTRKWIKAPWVVFLVVTLTIVEYLWFAHGLFARRHIVQNKLPDRFYARITAEGAPVRAYCTTGCLDRLTAQTHRIALLEGNNPVQLRSFVGYLEDAGGYRESSYHPILPPYTVFQQRPQPNAQLLAETATKFVVSSYPLADPFFLQIDEQDDYRLYRNTAAIMPYSDHYFRLALPGKG